MLNLFIISIQKYAENNIMQISTKLLSAHQLYSFVYIPSCVMHY